MRLEPGSPLVSVSRGLLVPETSLRSLFVDVVLVVGPFLVGSSFGGDFSCFRLVAAAALSMIFWDRSLTFWQPLLMNLGNNLATYVFWSMSSSIVEKRESNCTHISDLLKE